MARGHARGRPRGGGRAALDLLCRAYWFPVYAYARKQGCAEADAEDVTQDLFAEISRTEFLQRADPEHGRFRSCLLTAVRRRILNARTRAATVKRGGSVQIFSLDEPTAEERYRVVPGDLLTVGESGYVLSA